MTFSRLLSYVFCLTLLIFSVCVCVATIYTSQNFLKKLTSASVLDATTRLAIASKVNYLSGNFSQYPKTQRPVSTFIYLNVNGEILMRFGSDVLPQVEIPIHTSILSKKNNQMSASSPVYLSNPDPNIFNRTSPIGYIFIVFKTDYETKVTNTFIQVLIVTSIALFLITIPCIYLLANKISASMRNVVEMIEMAEKNDPNQSSVLIQKSSALHEIQSIISAFKHYKQQLEYSKKVSYELTQTLRREAEKNILQQRQMLASLSHEMRTPLQVIRAHAELMRSDINFINNASLARQMSRQIDSILTADASILHRVNVILAVCKNEEIELNQSTLTLSQWLNRFSTTVRPIIESFGNQLLIQDKANQESIRVDCKLLEQVLLILIDNACKFTVAGLIIMRIETVEQTSVCLEVEDTGPGISLLQQQTLFEPFARQQAPDNLQRDGLGLGLYLAKKLTAAIGGILSFSSQIGQGTVFRLTLPIGGVECVEKYSIKQSDIDVITK